MATYIAPTRIGYGARSDAIWDSARVMFDYEMTLAGNHETKWSELPARERAKYAAMARMAIMEFDRKMNSGLFPGTQS
jgi:hypothetical protein